MPTRDLALFPDMNTAGVERFRSRWEPPRHRRAAHITVTFPFEWPGPVSRLANAPHHVLATCKLFEFELSKATVWEDEYLFLLVNVGREQVRQLHESIHDQVLHAAQQPSHFTPHMTVGRHADKAALQVGISEAAELNLPLIGRALSVTVYRRDRDGGRIRELELPLGAAS